MNKKVKLDKQKDSITLNIKGLSHDGRGISLNNQITTFIPGALPGEEIKGQIVRKKNKYMEAQLLEVISPSKDRVIPPCEHFGVCGGCSLQHMSMKSQIALKTQTLLDQLKHFGHVEPAALLPPLSALEVGYRRKARLGVKFVIKKNKVLVGFREKSSRYLADLNACVILHPAVGQRLNALSDLISALSCKTHIAQIEVAMGDDEVALIFRHLVPLSPDDLVALVRFGKDTHFHIYLQPNPPAAVHKIWPLETSDRLSYSLPEEDLTFLFHPLDFTQINLEINRQMVKQAITLLALEEHETALDLFCGIGNFSLPLAKRVHQVTGVEGSSEMVERATENARYNHLHNVNFFAADLSKPTQGSSWIKACDKMVLDPPRVGAKEVMPFIPHFNAKKIVYISCNPATLARDAGDLVHQYGYHLSAVGIINMFPHTAHSEAMAVFER